MDWRRKNNLCSSCADIDLSPLIAPLPDVGGITRAPATEYEEKLAVYIDNFRLDRARSKPQCPLCSLLVECANRTGQERMLNHKNVCIRPKLLWSSSHDNQTAYQPSAQLCRSNQIHVWFHEIKSYNKSYNQRRPPGEKSKLGSGLSHLRSGILSLGRSSSRSKRPGSALFAEELASVSNENSGSDEEPSSRDDSDTRHDPEPSRITLEGELINRRRRRGLLGTGLLPASLKDPPSTPTLTIKSALASWMIDIIDEEISPLACNKLSIPRHADTAMIRQWLQNCDQGHSHSTAHSDLHPRIERILQQGLLRAIDTSSGDIRELPSQADFVALSYVWGRNVEQQSVTARPISEYAPTIRDAARFAKSLGFNWLWVDRICIDQNNEAEKSTLIPYIKDIFAAAKLTIVAASGDGAHCGLPGSPNTPRDVEKPLNIEVDGSKTILHLRPAPYSFNTLLGDCVWRTRGWTFEEQVFSRRLLYFFPSEIIFSCDKGMYRESTAYSFTAEPAGSTWSDFGATPPLIAAELNIRIHSNSTNHRNIMTTRQFVRAVEEYTSRTLTVEEDRVEAFAGLVAAATNPEDGIPERSLLKHGHPLAFFETALTWQHEEGFPPRYPRYGKPFVPSWSWASAGTKVHFLDNGEDANNWFHYGLVNGQDILGLPYHNNISKKLGLSFPTELIDRRPWLEDIPDMLPPSYHVAVSTPQVVSSSRRLPNLHLVTVVFEAMFHHASGGQHTVTPIIGSQQDRITGKWSISPEQGQINTIITGPERKTFAIVAGRWSIYIMALTKEPGENNFSRLGLLRVSEYGGAPLFTIMKQSSAHWDYIRLL